MKVLHEYLIVSLCLVFSMYCLCFFLSFPLSSHSLPLIDIIRLAIPAFKDAISQIHVSNVPGCQPREDSGTEGTHA